MTFDPRYPSLQFSSSRLPKLSAILAAALMATSAEAQWTDAGTYIHATDAPNVVVTDSGRVGVGTAAPSSPLHVAGEVRFDLGEGLLFYSNPDFWGTSQDSRNIRLIDGNNSQAVVDGGLVIETYTSPDNFRLPLMTVRHDAIDRTYFGFGALYPEHLFSLSSTWTLGAGKVDVSGVDVFGTGTSFLATIVPGSEVLIGGAVRRVEQVLSDTHLEVAKPFLATSTLANHRYNRPLFWITEQGRVTIGTPSGSAGLDLHGPLEVGGNLQIGDSLHGHRLDLYSGTNAIDFYVEGGGRYGRISTNASKDFVLQSSAPGGKIRISNDVHFRFSDLGSWQSIHAGEVVANTSLDVTGNLVLHPLPTGSSSGQVCYATGGSGGDRLVKCSSSERFKKDIQPLGSGMSIIEKLRPVTYAWTENGQRDLGFVAEEVARVEPLLAAMGQGTVEGVRYDKLTAVLVNAVQEQQTEIRRQREQIEALRALLCADRPGSSICSGS